jgi:hypothetical protein
MEKVALPELPAVLPDAELTFGLEVVELLEGFVSELIVGCGVILEGLTSELKVDWVVLLTESL